MKTFTITEEHLKLLQSMWVEWQYTEFGAPEIDPKRPYGNSSVESDLVEILCEIKPGHVVFRGKEYGYAYSDVVGHDVPQALIDILRTLHRETATALQICLRTQRFEPGTYEADNYRINWRKVS